MSCTHFLSFSFSSVYSSFIQILSFLSEENYGKREREAKDWVDPESFKNQTKPNTTLPIPPASKTALEIIYLLDKETYLKSTEILF